MATRRKTMRAWVVRWEWVGAHAEVAQPIAAVLRPQLRSKTVRLIVEALYAAREYQPDEMLSAFRQGGFNPYPARLGSVTVDPDGKGEWYTVPWEGEIYCGHNPFLRARLARVWPADGDSGRIEWEDDPRPGR